MRCLIVVLLVIGIYFYGSFNRVESYTISSQSVIKSVDCLIKDEIVNIEMFFNNDESRYEQLLVEACEAMGGIT